MIEYFLSVGRALGLILPTPYSGVLKDLNDELRGTDSSLKKGSETHVESFYCGKYREHIIKLTMLAIIHYTKLWHVHLCCYCASLD